MAFLSATPVARTQYLGPPQPPALVGPTVGASLRNAAAATHAQSGMVRKMASDWGRRAGTGAYSDAQFQQDFASVQFQFRMLREQFNGLGSLALQLGRPRASNAVAELDAGLNIIVELFTFLACQYSAGTLNQKTVAPAPPALWRTPCGSGNANSRRTARGSGWSGERRAHHAENNPDAIH